MIVRSKDLSQVDTPEYTATFTWGFHPHLNVFNGRVNSGFDFVDFDSVATVDIPRGRRNRPGLFLIQLGELRLEFAEDVPGLAVIRSDKLKFGRRLFQIHAASGGKREFGHLNRLSEFIPDRMGEFRGVQICPRVIGSSPQLELERLTRTVTGQAAGCSR